MSLVIKPLFFVMFNLKYTHTSQLPEYDLGYAAMNHADRLG